MNIEVAWRDDGFRNGSTHPGDYGLRPDALPGSSQSTIGTILDIFDGRQSQSANHTLNQRLFYCIIPGICLLQNEGAMRATQRYATLDGLRGIAAFVVVGYHTHIFRGSSGIAPHGYLAVDFFFMLSGFVIASAYEKKLEAGSAVIEFFKHRVIRLYPVALVGVLLGALRLLAHYAINPLESEPALWIALAILPNIFILPVLSQTHFNGELFPANGPLWSLFGEFLVNLGWSMLVSLKSSFIIIVFLMTASGIILFSLMHHAAIDDFGWNSQYVLGAACRVTFSFLLGTVIYRFHEALPNLPKQLGITSSAFVMTALLLVLGMPWFETVWDAMAIFLFLPAILMLGVLCGREPTAPIRSLLGEMSYPIYAIHFPIFLLISEFRKSIFPSLDVPVAISIGVLLVLAAAFALNRLDHWLRAQPAHKSTFAPTTMAGRIG